MKREGRREEEWREKRADKKWKNEKKRWKSGKQHFYPTTVMFQVEPSYVIPKITLIESYIWLSYIPV